MRRRAASVLLVAALTFLPADPAFAYLKLGVQANGRQVALKWTRSPVRYFVSERGVAGVGSTDLQATLARAFGTWQAVPTASITFQFAGYTAAQPLEQDGASTIGFRERPDLDRVLASTNFLIDSATGELLESDIFFNAAFPWSTAPAGEPGKYDLESVALHEIGHLSGLGHSALGETELRPEGGRRVIASGAAMFPIAFAAGNVSGRTLRPDDIAGISDVYPDGGVSGLAGSLSGSVTRNGAGVFGAHVVAFNPATGTVVAGFTLNAQGQFTIAGLSPGPHIVRVEPLDDADISSFFDPQAPVDLGFRVTFHDRLVIVPRGGDSGAVVVQVTPK